ncbi:MAG: site-specific integrase, partial [Gammaproteobacteria bacterium]|nr:site-specific integrase [Gammaproteobacteria bacterium]
DMTISKTVKELGIPAVPHGFRSSFRDWCADTGQPREVAEACLAHIVMGVEGAYARSDLLGRRRAVMEAWSRYVASDNVVALREIA